MDLYQQYIHISRYSRWRDDLGRRETWPETVQRYVDWRELAEYEKTDNTVAMQTLACTSGACELP